MSMTQKKRAVMLRKVEIDSTWSRFGEKFELCETKEKDQTNNIRMKIEEISFFAHILPIIFNAH